ncbi:MAG TPA: ATP-binding protein, partial [Bacteroidota bacterium]|nr:ATP-binding protein [Bacteroidota bacterium]
MNKEVSCVALQPIFDALRERNLPVEMLCRGVPYDLAYLNNKRERIEWEAYCIMMGNLRPDFSDEELERLGYEAVKTPMFHATSVLVRQFTSVPEFYAWFATPPGGPGVQWFACIINTTKIVGRDRVIMTLELPPGYRYCREFFLITKGSLTAGPRVLGLGPSAVTMHPTQNGASYDIRCPKGGGSLAWIRKAIRWPLAVRRAARELDATNKTLLIRYAELEELQSKSQRQAIQLKAAYDIGRLMHSELDIDSTLQAIVQSLADVAHFAGASISLDTAVEDETVKRSIRAGVEFSPLPAITRALESHGKKTGEVTVWLARGAALPDAEELLEYVVPVIAMEVDDALSFKIVNDYRDSLQQKVNERTAELQRINDSLKLAQAGRDRLFANISHEFRTPLTLILGPARQLMDRLSDEKHRDQVNLIERSGRKLARLVDELLDIAKIESGQMKLKASAMDLGALVRETALPFNAAAERKRASFTVSLEDGAIQAYVDKDKFDKILSNLLSNAFKFTAEGGAVTVRVGRDIASSDAAGIDVARIRVSDTGIGVPRDQLEKIFDRFYQVEGGHTREHEGAGIGLALAKELAELHRWKLEVESEEGKGSTFTIVVPLGKGHLRSEEVCEEMVAQVEEKDQYYEESGDDVQKVGDTAAVGRAESHRPALPMLLIIEDNVDVRSYVRTILEKSYGTIEARDGEEGLELAVEQIPDLIILDIMMPKLDGFEVCKRLKSDLRTSHIPVVMLTAKAAIEDKIIGLETGADAYLTKPFEPNELEATLRNLIAQRKRIHEYYRKHGLVELDQGKITSTDQKFMQRAADLIREQLSDASFGVQAFAEC